MNILIDIGHPAHVHLLKNTARIMIDKGHKVLFTTRDKEVTLHLLRHEGFDFVSFGKPYKKVLGKLWGLLKFDWKLWRTARRFKPDLFLSSGSFYAAHASALMRKPHITLEDTGNMEQVRLYLPFTEAVLVSNAFHRDFGEKQVVYDGYHELAYLHPNQFTPNPQILQELGIDKDTVYAIVRFVSWGASHDIGQGGFSLESKIALIKELSKHARVFISAESGLPEELESYGIRISPEKMHDAMAFASLYIGEGATMASECAMLGTPAIYVNTLTAGTLEEQEKYGLLFGFRDGRGVMEKAVELLNTPDLKGEWLKRRDKMLEEKIDVTAFIVKFIEEFKK